MTTDDRVTDSQSLAVGPDREIKLHFAIRLENGELIDSTFEREPVSFRYADGNLLPGFERAMAGLVAGDHQHLRILPEQGFGMHNPSNVQWLPKQQFSDITLEPGLVVSFAANEGELPGVVRSVEGEQVQVDFNHPLAGHTLLFEVQILNVSPV